MHFVRTFSIMRAYGVRLIVIKKVRNFGKIVFIKVMFENGWCGADASPLPALITMALTTSPTSRFGFSMIRGKFCHRCFERTAGIYCFCTVWTFYFKNKGLVFKGVGFDPLTPPPACATDDDDYYAICCLILAYFTKYFLCTNDLSEGCFKI